MAAVNVTTSSLHSVPGDRIFQQNFISQAQTNPDYYGMLYVVNTTRVTRCPSCLASQAPLLCARGIAALFLY